jgi:hypothetical protein
MPNVTSRSGAEQANKVLDAITSILQEVPEVSSEAKLMRTRRPTFNRMAVKKAETV